MTRRIQTRTDACSLFLRGGDFVPGRLYDETTERLLTETWRRLVLEAPVDEDRLSEGFRDQLFSWRHQGGFSVDGRHRLLNEEPARLAHMARYALRAPARSGPRDRHRQGPTCHRRTGISAQRTPSTIPSGAAESDSGRGYFFLSGYGNSRPTALPASS